MDSVSKVCKLILLLLLGIVEVHSQGFVPPTVWTSVHTPPASPIILDSLPRTFYISSSTGNDTNDGRTTGTAWRSLNRLNSRPLIVGDSIRFKGGDIIYGSYVYGYFTGTNYDTLTQWNLLSSSKFDSLSNYIVFNSYGTGKATLTIDTTKIFILNIANVKTLGIKFHITNLKFKGAYNPITFVDTNKSSYGIYMSNPSGSGWSSVLIDSCEFTRFRNSCIGLFNTNNVGRTAFGIPNTKRYGKLYIKHNIIDSTGDNGISTDRIAYQDFQIIGNRITNIFSHNRLADYQASGITNNYCRDALIERNYINNIGYGSDYSNGFAGIHANYCRNIVTRYNEVKNVRNSVGAEGGGIYYDVGGDSCIIEYNYIVNCNFGFSIASPQVTPVYMPAWDDSSSSIGIISRFNIIIGDSGSITGAGGYIGGGFLPFQPPAKRNFVYNNIFYFKSSFDRGETSLSENFPSNLDSITDVSVIRHFGYFDSTYTYNNIFIAVDSNVLFWKTSSTVDLGNNYYNSNETNTKSYNNIYYNLQGKYKFKEQVVGYSLFPNFHFFYKTYSTINSWSDATLIEKNSGVYSYILGNPLIKRISQYDGREVNPYSLDTLTAYQFLAGSPADNTGVNFNSQVRRFLPLIDTARFDWHGTIIPYSNPDIGIYVKP